MSVTPRVMLEKLARDYLLAHEDELGVPEEDLEGFESAVRDLANELDGAVADRQLEWLKRRRSWCILHRRYHAVPLTTCEGLEARA